MNNGNIGNIGEGCRHMLPARAYYVRNDGQGPPVVFVSGHSDPCVITLTNQLIKIQCPQCFAQIRLL